MESNWITYIVECSDESLYTGITNNLDKRIEKHNSGKGAKYTRNRLPVKLVYFIGDMSKSDAAKLEYKIKKMSREDKIRLINSK